MRRCVVALSLATSLGCQTGGSTAALSVDRIDMPEAPSVASFPQDAAGFLAALLPSSRGDVRVTYDVTGPAGLAGELTVTARAGGYRREAWTVDIPLPSVTPGEASAEPVRVQGSRIVTPDAIWTDAVEGAAVVRSAPLGSLARAYEELDPGLQSLVSFRIDQWHAQIETGRSNHPGETEQTLGRSCLLTRVASHRVCVWEDTGLPLSYSGDTFNVVAREIETDLHLDGALFEIPAGGQRAVDDGIPIDGYEAVVRLAAGDYADLAAWLRPSVDLG